MKRIKRFFLILTILISVLLSAESIYDIQFTENAGGGTYPSTYEGQVVTVSGIVSCNNYNGQKYVLSSSEGGAWQGLLIYDSAEFELGDEVMITGIVMEYYGLTEIIDPYSTDLLSTGNDIAGAEIVNTQEISVTEAYEGVLVEVRDVMISAAPDQWGIYSVDDGTGSCRVGGICYAIGSYDNYPEEGLEIEMLRGIVTYSYGEYLLLPRSREDIIFSEENLSINIEDITAMEASAELTINMVYIGEPLTIETLYLEMIYNPQMLEYNNADYTDTILEGTGNELEHDGDRLIIDAEGIEITESSDLIKIQFSMLQEGYSSISVMNLEINGEETDNYKNGSILWQPIPDTLADEISLIQRPILSVPAIIEDGEQLNVICAGNEDIQMWQAELQWKDYHLPLTTETIEYDTDKSLWNLEFSYNSPDIYTNYDLVVWAEYVLPDTARNAVSIIPEYKTEYQFIHVTDTHLPGHTFWGNDPEGEDFTEIEDFQKVINEINVIQPEFVLLTGDVVNEGELEGYNGRYQYSRAKNLISRLTVPVFITTGNHDVGGWNDTYPPDGSSRLNWRRFFGWEYLENNEDIHTQNYYFEYDEILFIGMDSYINYDSYLPMIFGDSSFTGSQMDWLNEVISSYPLSTKVLFYHFDFDEEINLSNLGVDMALYGHIHSNSGDINSYPCNLATDAVCDGNSAFRVINVINDQLFPQNTCYVQNGIEIDYTLPNSGVYPENQAEIRNPYGISLDDCGIACNLPYAEEYELTGCSLDYIYDNSSCNEIAVKFDLPANGTVSIGISAVTGIQSEDIQSALNLQAYPNPFNPSLNISYELSYPDQVEISIFNIKGQKTAEILNDKQVAGTHNMQWEASKNKISSGVYFLSLKTNSDQVIKRVLLLK